MASSTDEDSFEVYTGRESTPPSASPNNKELLVDAFIGGYVGQYEEMQETLLRKRGHSEVLMVAMEKFATLGFADTRLETIARESGMSKRMIHYHFGDKRGLYQRTLELAIALLRPTRKQIQSDSAVVVDGVRTIVEAVFNCYVEHPNAVKLLLIESMQSHGRTPESKLMNDKSAVILELDKLLMRGQDIGAFRPGISAQDVFVLIASLAVFRISNTSIMNTLYSIDMTDEENTEGMKRMAIEATVAFLTSNIKSSDAVSYLTTSTNEDEEDTDASYEITDALFD